LAIKDLAQLEEEKEHLKFMNSMKKFDEGLKREEEEEKKHAAELLKERNRRKYNEIGDNHYSPRLKSLLLKCESDATVYFVCFYTLFEKL
jgi:hypothetical protein